jgi:hypothetical protein
VASFINPIPVIQGAANAAGKFVVIALGGPGVIIFDWFPSPSPGIGLSRRANWQEQETTIGTKPLFYMNRDPRKLDVQEVWLDKTDTNESITPQIERLMSLQDEVANGTPPPCLVLWGDRQERCVLEEIHIEEVFHHRSGFPMRARVTLNFKELQSDAVGR